jgi:uncharacterized protein (DUF169 family)
MDSTITTALKLPFAPVAILFSDEKPQGAMQFEKGRWGCVMAVFGAAAEKGRTCVFDRESYGCWGGGVGLGFGNVYHTFLGGMDGFCSFLSDGNMRTEKGRAVCEQAKQFLRGSMLEEFMHGEGYRKNPEMVRKFVEYLPITEVPTRYVVFKPLAAVTAEEKPESVVFLANPDQLSALLILANYSRGDDDNAIIPHAAGCQSIGIYTYREGKSAKPRAVVGLNDLSARKTLRRLGKDLMTFSVPLALFQEMEANVSGSFLERETWRSLQ